MDWGNNPDTWIAVATVTATLAAIGAGVFAFLTFRQMREQTEHVRDQVVEAQKQAREAADQTELVREQLERERERDVRSQAEAIQVWTEVRREDGGDEYKLTAHAKNNSSAPIFDLFVGLDLGAKGKPDVWYVCGHHILAARGRDVDALNLKVAPPTYSDWQKWAVRHPVNKHPRVEIQFRDSKGHRWIRDYEGRLSILPDDAPEKPAWVSRRSDESSQA